MNYIDKIERISVLGAAGKMGSGILLLTAVEMAEQSLKPENRERTFVLNAMDVSDKALSGLMQFIKTQATKIAEKKTLALREAYADRKDLVENGDIIDQFVFDVMNIIRPVTNLAATYDSQIIFEAVSENKSLKVKLFSAIEANNPNKPWYLTNTSSVPINEIDDEVGLNGRIIGFHFYNPPAVQKLVELIATDKTQKELTDFALMYAKNLRKKIVPSNDFAGFIGNGHFMRDALHAIDEVEKLSSNYSFTEAVYMMNKVSQDFLIRPMGIFQLIDYVGVDVVRFILDVMNPYYKDENLNSTLLEKLMEMGVKGGQNSNGSQKDGFLKYERGRPVAAFDVETKQYIAFDNFASKCDATLGNLPKSFIPWKNIIRLRDRSNELTSYFNELANSNNLGSELAIKYGKRSNAIGKKLVADNVAHNNNDVNTVMLTGFFHSYGPINNYFG